MSTSTSEDQAIALTISSLTSESTLPSHQSQSLIRPSAGNPPAAITTLVHLAQQASSANALACGSILAGPSSDSTEYGDVGIWLGEGPYGRGCEREVLDALGLGVWSEGEVCVKCST